MGYMQSLDLNTFVATLTSSCGTSSENPAFPSMLRVSHPSVTSGTVPVIYELYNHQQNARDLEKYYQLQNNKRMLQS